jgi:hypothetical protein
MVFIRMIGEVKDIDNKIGYLKIEDKDGAGYIIRAETNQLSGISLGDRVDVEVEWARGKASSIKRIGKV